MPQKKFVLQFKPRNVKRVHNSLYCVFCVVLTILLQSGALHKLLYFIFCKICFVLSLFCQFFFFLSFYYHLNVLRHCLTSFPFHLQVKADRGSKKLGVLQQASRHVNEMAANVVASTKTGLEQIEDKGKCDVKGAFGSWFHLLLFNKKYIVILWQWLIHTVVFFSSLAH